MRVLLLNPNFTIKEESKNDFSFFPPLGLAYLAACLEQKKITVDVKDLNLFFENGEVAARKLPGSTIRYGMSDETIKTLIRDFAPDLVGVSSIFTPFYRDAERICMLVKEVSPDILTAIGGAHASMEYKEVIKHPAIDFVIRGEGEIPFTKFVERLSQNRDWNDVPGIVWKRADGSLGDNGMGEQVKDLDTLPLPAYRLLDMKFYTSRKDKNFAYSMRFPIGHMITSRGCPYTCVFCSTRNFFPNYRVHSASRVMEEIDFLIKEYGVQEIHFHDDAYLIQKKRVKEISQKMIDGNYKLRWQISQGVNLNLVDEELLLFMHKSGMYRMGLPIESGSENILKMIRKRVELDHAKKIIALANRLGVFTHANFIIGFPFEGEEDIEKTHEFAASCGVDFLKILICQPLAGAELYDVYKQEGLLDQVQHSSTYTSTEYGTKHFSADQLNQRRKQILKSYKADRFKRFVTPSKFAKTIWPKVNSPENFVYAARLGWLMLREKLI